MKRLLLVVIVVMSATSCGEVKKNNPRPDAPGPGIDAPGSTSCVLGTSHIGNCTL